MPEPNKYKEAEQYVEKLTSEFEQGKLPAAFLDKERIVDPEDPAARKFAAYMQGIAKRLLGKEYDAQKHHVRFLLSADDEPNAFIISAANPPVVAFTKGLLKILKTEDQVAAVLCHELEHENLHQRFGKHKNSSMEESWADIGSMLKLERAGYQAEAMRDALAALPLPTKDLFTRVLSVADEHPEMHTRIRNVEDAQAWLERNKGRSKVTATPLNRELKTEFTAVMRPSDLSQKLKAMGFETMGTAQKLDALTGLLHKEIAPLMEYEQHRAEELKEIVSKLEIKKDEPAQVAATERFLNQMVLRPKEGASTSWSDNAGGLAGAVQTAWDTTNGITKEPNPRYSRDQYSWGREPEFYKVSSFPRSMLEKRGKEVEPVFEEFVTAETPQQIEQAAARVNAMVDKYNFSNIIYLNKSRLSFPLPEEDVLKLAQEKILAAAPGHMAQAIAEHALRPSWDKHVEAYRKTGSPVILEALQHLGVTDPRLPVRKASVEVIAKPETRSHNNALRMERVYISPEGGLFAERLYPERNIVLDPAHPDTLEKAKEWIKLDYKMSLQADRNRLKHIDNIHKAILPSMKWEELATDYWGFIDKYKDYLHPEITLTDGSKHFAEAFMQHSQALVQKDPATYGPLQYEFLHGRPKGEGLEYVPPADQHPPHHTLFSLYKECEKQASAISIQAERSDSELIPRGMPLDHPYIQSVLHDPESTNGDKMAALALTRFLRIDADGDPRTPANKMLKPEAWIKSPRELLGYKPPQTIGELNGLLFTLIPHDDKEMNASELAMFFLGHLMAFETAPILADTSLKVNRDELRFLAGLNVENVLDGGQEIRASALGSKPFKPTGRITELRQKLLAHELNAATPARDTIDGYFYINADNYSNEFLKDPALRKRFEEKIRHDVDSCSTPQAKSELLTALLFSRNIPHVGLAAGSPVKLLARNWESDLEDPEFRKWAVDGMIDAQVRILGKDDGSKRYFNKIKHAVEEIAGHTTGVVRYQLLAGIMDKVSAQRDISYYAREKVAGIDLNRIMEFHMKTSIGELAVEKLGDNPDLAKKTVDFLRKPPTHENVEQYKKEIEVAIRNDKYKWDRLTDDQKTDFVYKQHRGFWQLPFEGRSLYLSRILFPSQDSEAKNFAATRDRVLDETFPKGGHYADEGRMLVEAYLNVSDIRHQRLLLSAMMVANEPSIDPATGKMRNMRTGETLNYVLGSMGAAGRKLLQAIHSHPDTPQDIKDDIAQSKTMSSKPDRWALHKRLEDVGPQAKTPQEKIVHVGDILGAGAYGVTVETTKQNGQETAVTLLRENVRGQAEFEFDNYMRAAQALTKQGPRMRPVMDMIRQAGKMSVIETDMDLATKQSRIADKLYNGLTIEVDGHQFHFSAAKLLGIGAEYKETAIVPGAHFNDLLTEKEAEALHKKDPKKYAEWAEHNAPVSEAYKKASAKALLAAEVLSKAKGGCTDHDRHGGQQRIMHAKGGHPVLDKGGHSFVGQFDFGAINPNPPALEDKRALVESLINAYRISSSKAPNTPTFLDALSQQIDHYNGKASTKDYLSEFKRGMLALGDIAAPLNNQDMADIGGAVIKTMSVDRELVDEAAFSMRFSDVPMLLKAAKSGLSGLLKKSSIKITENNEAMPTLPSPQKSASHLLAEDDTQEKRASSRDPHIVFKPDRKTSLRPPSWAKRVAPLENPFAKEPPVRQ